MMMMMMVCDLMFYSSPYEEREGECDDDDSMSYVPLVRE